MSIRVDARRESDFAELAYWRYAGRVIGQDRAVREVVRAIEKFKVNLKASGRPICNLLFMGPTGSGKTQVCRATAEILLGSPDYMTKIDCGEFKHSHEVAKLLGSPPGYLGHRESKPRLSQENIDRWSIPKVRAENGEVLGRSNEKKPNIVLFDEIEKAHEDFFDLLLSIMEDGKLVLGNGETTDFSRTILIMTSNLSSREVRGLIKGATMGFHTGSVEMDREDLDEQIYKTAKDAAEKFFKAEFINRLDRLIVFRSLSEQHLEEILDLELTKVQRRINLPPRYIPFKVLKPAKKFLLERGTSELYGARALVRIVEKHVAEPISNLLSTQQICTGDTITIGYEDGDHLTFDKTRDPVVYRGASPEELTK